MTSGLRRRCLAFMAAVAVLLAGGSDPAGARRPAGSGTEPPARRALRSIQAWLQPLVDRDPGFHCDPEDPRGDLGDGMQLVFEGMRPFLSDTLQCQFLGLSADSLRHEWYRRYWALRDPTPTTPENEVLDEHERRVRWAHEQCAARGRRFWDERGDFYVLYGAPAAVRTEPADVRIGVGYQPQRQIWSYPEAGVTALFEQPNPGGPWLLGNSAAKQTNRPDVLHDAMQSDAVTPVVASRLDADQPAWSELAPDARAPTGAWVPPEGAIAAAGVAEEGRERYVLPGAPGRFLACIFDADAFRGAPVRVEVHVQVAVRDLAFQWEDSLYVARYRVEGVLLDEAVRRAASDAYDDVVRARAVRTTQEAILWPAQLVFEVTPGIYRLSLRVLDKRSGDRGTFTADVRVPALDASTRLVLSDVEMATSIAAQAVAPSTRFAKGWRVVIPNPAATYGPGRSLTAYFEIYGLQPDGGGRCRYEVSYDIAPRTRRRYEGFLPKEGFQEPPHVTARFAGEAGAADVPEEIHVDVGALEPDAYDLLVLVRDHVAGTEARTRSIFIVER